MKKRLVLAKIPAIVDLRSKMRYLSLAISDQRSKCTKSGSSFAEAPSGGTLPRKQRTPNFFMCSLFISLSFSLRIQGEIIYAPPPSPILAKRHFSGEGGGVVYFEGPRGRNFIRPPFYTPPPLGGYFQGWGGGGV